MGHFAEGLERDLAVALEQLRYTEQELESRVDAALQASERVTEQARICKQCRQDVERARVQLKQERGE